MDSESVRGDFFHIQIWIKTVAVFLVPVYGVVLWQCLRKAPALQTLPPVDPTLKIMILHPPSPNEKTGGSLYGLIQD